jgi:DEAD/DEAH box helicase domain-containing protein
LNLAQLLDQLKADDAFLRNVTRWEVAQPRPAHMAAIPDHLDPRLISALQKRGIDELYTHQASAIECAAEGEPYVVVTPTASGKTLCYNLPVLDTILRDPQARALYLFPTKALSQDQMHEVHGLITDVGADIKTYTFDGDTPEPARRAIRSSGHIVVTNPDMLHQGVLPHHTLWVKLFENLKYVVVDEVHHYRGVFGSHVANVLRRLRRIARFYGSDPLFIGCSATIANPGELAAELAGNEVRVIDNNGAPTGEKHVIFYNPPVVNRELGIRRSAVKETRMLAEKFLKAKSQLIVFARSRTRVELLLTYLEKSGRKVGIKSGEVRGYRGGYLPTERRAIERGLRDGSVRAVVSTNALELGIDIGRLDVCVMCGYAGTVASSWQQAGRAGRSQNQSVAIMVATSNPLDQYVVSNPEWFFGRGPEQAAIDPNNLIILLSHLKCAAFELTFEEGELYGDQPVAEILEYLESQGVLHLEGGRFHWMADTYPAEDVSLRSAAPDNVVIIDASGPRGVVIGEMDLFSSQEMLHDEAVYIHGGRQYHVDKLDWERSKAYVRPVDVDYYTDAQRKTELKTLSDEEGEPVRLGRKGLGEIGLISKVTVYKKIKLGTHENVGAGRIHLPQLEMHTTSFWWELPDALHAQMSDARLDLGDALKGLAHLLGNVVPAFVMADPSDLRTLPMVRSTFTDRPTLYIYDAYPGGVGYSQRIYGQLDDILGHARNHLDRCACESGCPSCVGAQVESGATSSDGVRWILAAYLDAYSDAAGG